MKFRMRKKFQKFRKKMKYIDFYQISSNNLHECVLEFALSDLISLPLPASPRTAWIASSLKREFQMFTLRDMLERFAL